MIGVVTILWSIVCLLVVYDVPADHPRISRAELDYLTAVVQQSTIDKVNKYILTLSVPLFSDCSTISLPNRPGPYWSNPPFFNF